jgi:NADPH:quinone reductase-like Zn-dependent oxidoreductase
VRRIPENISAEVAAAVPAVAGTALHAIALAGGYPNKLLTKNKAALVHSAAGGVGSMLLQICKLCGFAPVVGIVGSPRKMAFCQSLGADAVIDKSKLSSPGLWREVEAASPDGFAAVFDANGVSTLAGSYDHLARCGRLVTYGFHSNVPRTTGLLSPLAWLGMAYKLLRVPRFDPMHLVLASTAVLGFNLSFFADEHDVIADYMDRIAGWLEQGLLVVPEVTVIAMQDIAQAHELIQSGQSIGKIVIRTNEMNS